MLNFIHMDIFVKLISFLFPLNVINWTALSGHSNDQTINDWEVKYSTSDDKISLGCQHIFICSRN